MRRRWTVLGVVALGLLFGVAVRSALLAVGRVVGVLLVVALLVGCLLLVTATPAYRRSRVGVGSRVLERPLGTATGTGGSAGSERAESERADGSPTCVVCDGAADGGVRRTFVREWVLLGVPLVLLDRGENAYCPACVESDPLEEEHEDGDGDVDEDRERERPSP